MPGVVANCSVTRTVCRFLGSVNVFLSCAWGQGYVVADGFTRFASVGDHRSPAAKEHLENRFHGLLVLIVSVFQESDITANGAEIPAHTA